MIQKLRHIVISLTLISTLSGVGALVIAPSIVAKGPCDAKPLLTFPAWYRYLYEDTGDGAGCHFEPARSGKDKDVDIVKTITIIGINITEIVLQLVAYATIVMLIVGGFMYMTSAGDSAKMGSAKNTIRNAIIGLIISIFSVAIVNLVAESVK